MPIFAKKQISGMILNTNVKLNLGLNVLRKRPDGYHDIETLFVPYLEMGDILENSGVSPEHAEAFCRRCEEELGKDTPLRPANISSASRMEIQTPEVKISVDPKNSRLIQTRVIDGHKYILISADAGVELNGLAVEIRGE